MRKVLRVIFVILSHRVTYQFLIVLLGALGVTTASDDIGRLEDILCSIIGGCS